LVLAQDGDSAIAGQFVETDEAQDPMEKLLSHQLIQPRYEKCQAFAEKDNDLVLGDCIWNGKGDPSDTDYLKPLDPSTQQQIHDYLAQGKNNKKLKENTLESLDVSNLKRKQADDSANKRLHDFLTKEIEKTLYGNINPNDGTRESVARHDSFNKLFKSQLGKNILFVISDTCMDAQISSDNKHIQIDNDPDKRRTVRKDNLKKLEQKVDDTDKDGKAIETLGAYKFWGNCMQLLPATCENVERDGSGNPKPKNPNNPKPGEFLALMDADTNTGFDSKDIKYTQGRACQAVRYIKDARQNLIAIDQINKQYKKLESEGQGIALAVAKDEDIDKALTHSSKALGEAVNMEQDKIQFQNCVSYSTDNDGKVDESTVKVNDTEQCKKYFASKDSGLDQKSKLAEYDLRRRTIASALDNATDEQLKELLIEEGYTEEQAGQAIADDLDKIKEQIKTKYDRERDALVKSIHDEINNNTAANGDTVNDGADAEKLKLKAKEMEYKAERFKQLIHFNNIVTGFIDITDKNKKSVNNTGAMEAELEDSAFADQDNFKDIQDTLSNVGPKNGASGDEDTPTLEVNIINTKIIKHEGVDALNPKDDDGN
jgi:hypothetical protein